MEEKKNQLRELAGDTILRGEEFKRYVNKLRARSSIYKRSRTELAAYKAEAGVLSRTCEVLSSRDKGVLRGLVRIRRILFIILHSKKNVVFSFVRSKRNRSGGLRDSEKQRPR